MEALYELAKAEELFTRLLEPELPGVRLTTFPLPEDRKKLPLVVMSCMSLLDKTPDAQHWSVSFVVTGKNRSESLEVATKIYFLMIRFSNESAGIPGVGFVGHHIPTLKPSRSSGQDHACAFTVTLQV